MFVFFSSFTDFKNIGLVPVMAIPWEMGSTPYSKFHLMLRQIMLHMCQEGMKSFVNHTVFLRRAEQALIQV